MKPQRQHRIVPIRIPRRLGLGVAILAALPYLPAIFHDFTFDDASIVAHNSAVQEWGHWKQVFFSDYWPGGKSALYRPVTILSFALERSIHGASPAGFHLVNILLHAGTSLMVLCVSSQILGAGWAAGLAAGIFALHPVHSEVVSGVVGRSELLSSLLALCALWIWAKQKREGNKSSELQILSLGLYFLAMLSKESVIVLPGLVVLWGWIHQMGRPLGERLLKPLRSKHLWGMIAVAGLCLLLRAAALGSVTASFRSDPPFVENPLAGMELSKRALNAAAHQAHGVLLQIWPRPLVADYSYKTFPTESIWIYPRAALLTLLAGGTLALWWCRNALAANLAFAFSWYFISILPTSNILLPIGTIFAERLLYFPSIGLCLAAGAIWKAFGENVAPDLKLPETKKARWLLGGSATLLLILLASAGLRNLAWKNDLTLFTDTVAKAPTNVKAHLWLADALVRAGNLESAIAHYKRAIEILPSYGPAAANLMVPLQMLGRHAEAIEAGEGALALLPEKNPALYYNLAMTYMAAGNPERFMDYAQRVLSLDPDSSRMHFQLGKYYMQQTRDRKSARQHLERALEVEPDMPEAPLIHSMLRQLRN